MKNLVVLAIFSLACIACKDETKKAHTYEDEVEVRDPKIITSSSEEKMSTTTEAIANANGFQNWNKVKEIKFTFNVDKDTTHFERSWNWKTKENIVTMTSAQDTITYNRAKMDSTTLKVDPGFINDKYWLLAPFNLIWDAKNFASKHFVKSIAPISGKEMQKLTIIYKNKGGYTPGDAYDFYFEGDFIIKEWVYRKGNTPEPSMITSWEDYKNYNGIKIAKTHKRDEGDFTLHFTNIEVITE